MCVIAAGRHFCDRATKLLAAAVMNVNNENCCVSEVSVDFIIIRHFILL